MGGSGSKEDKLMKAIEDNKTKNVKSILKGATKNKILKLNEKNVKGNYPLLMVTDGNNIEMLQLLTDYANENSITLELNEKNKEGYYPLLMVIAKHNNLKMVQLLIEYANKKNIQLKLNEKSYDELYPLLMATIWNNMEMVKLIFKYANDHSVKLDIDEEDIKEYIKLFNQGKYKYGDCTKISKINKKIIEMWQEYKKTEEEKLMEAIYDDDNEKVKSILENTTRKAKLKLNDKDKDDYTPLLMAASNNNIEVVKLLLEYASKNNVQLALNKKNGNGYTPIIYATDWNNLEMIQLLLNYAKENNIVLELNEKNNLGEYPFLKATIKNNMDIVQLLSDYVNENGIQLAHDENVLKEYCEKHKDESWCPNYSEINPDILKMWG